MTKIDDILSGLDEKKKEPVIIAETEPVPEAVEEKPEPPRVAIKASGGDRRWLLVGIGILVMVLGFVGIMSFGESRNMGLGLIAVLSLFGGGGLIYFGFQKKDETLFINPEGKANTGPANCINIYPDGIRFEQIDDVSWMGHPRKLRNDNKYYYVNIWGIAWGGTKEELVRFRLPDTQYNDPREFANNINIPAHRRLAQRRATMMEKITPWALVGGMGVVMFLWILV